MNIIYLIDFNCPYSYIGLERIKKAIENQNINAEWEMKAFELESEAGKRPTISTTERYCEKNNVSKKEAESKIAEIEKTAQDDGLKINYKDMLLTSSKDALRLSKFAQNMHPELTLKLVEEIFYSNLVKNENIADIKVLTEIAISCGIEESEAKKILENNYYNIECFLDMEEALSHGISATPCFILEKDGGRLIIPGVFSYEEFEIALKDFESGEIKDKTFI
ncbi:MAG: DsbA family protein [Methanobrevibacter sp.]|uniref:DsbA family oxidoreductase n=1 Tax=Methanobrevibacter sp. TaxID=66852 RepID=UPI0025DEFC4D|nr:DsbA family protein [Methanobrevibacter sp.]MBQ6100330.1 DsbA family protein [Methanobrevibacter sp.]